MVYFRKDENQLQPCDEADSRLSHVLLDLQEWNAIRGYARIARERANADRDLTPKKERLGYVLQRMTPVIRQGRSQYRITLQTPLRWDTLQHDEAFGAINRDLQVLLDLVGLDRTSVGKPELSFDVGRCPYWYVDFTAQKPIQITKELLP